MSDRQKEIDGAIEVIVRSIPKEREARDLYRSAAASSTMEMTRRLFEYLAAQEEEHEEKLRAVLYLLESERGKPS
jgi:rubrerythrin